MDQLLQTQDEIVNNTGHMAWRRVVLRDFGEGHAEVSMVDYETWSEPDPRPWISQSRKGGGRQGTVKRTRCKACKAAGEASVQDA